MTFSSDDQDVFESSLTAPLLFVSKSLDALSSTRSSLLMMNRREREHDFMLGDGNLHFDYSSNSHNDNNHDHHRYDPADSSSHEGRDLASSSSTHHASNYSYTSTVTIRVTPRDDYLVSWGTLWGLFVLTSLIAGIQIYKEQRVLSARCRAQQALQKLDDEDDVDDDVEKPTATRKTYSKGGAGRAGGGGGISGGSGSSTRVNIPGGGPYPGSGAGGGGSSHRGTPPYRTSSCVSGRGSGGGGGGGGGAHSGSSVVGVGDGESVSSADLTRGLFRRLILLAMITRVIVIPIQIWSDPLWWQFVGDTLPEMVFASAWTTLVTFLVQLVGIATGTGTSTTPGTVIQSTAYVVYTVLIITQVWNHVATILLYALMCCIYAALFGTVSFYCPRLLTLLRPSLMQSSQHYGGVTVRLLVSGILCFGLFLSHTIGYARLVISPPREVYWWWKYGVLELLPSVTFLIMMNPASNKTKRSESPVLAQEEIGTTSATGVSINPKAAIKRIDSASSANSGNNHPHQQHHSRTGSSRILPTVTVTGSVGGSVGGSQQQAPQETSPFLNHPSSVQQHLHGHGNASASFKGYGSTTSTTNND